MLLRHLLRFVNKNLYFIKEFAIFYFCFLFVDDGDLKTNEKTFNKKWLVFFGIY